MKVQAALEVSRPSFLTFSCVDHAIVKTPVAAGEMVSVLGEVMVNAAVDRVQKQMTLPAPAPVELRITA